MATPKQSVHSEYNTLSSVLLCRPEIAFQSPAKINRQWESLNYIDAPVMVSSRREYSSFLALLASVGTQMEFLPGNKDLSMDAMYCRDASIATDFGMIICRMGKKARSAEPQQHKQLYEQLNIPVLGVIEAPGTLEGGDVAWVDHQTLAVGLSYRTNMEGIRQLKVLLEPNGVEVVQVDLPHYQGPEDVFHLMSIFSPVDKDLAVVYSPLMPISFRNFLVKRGYDFVEAPDEEFLSMGCNVLALSPRKCLLVEGNPITESVLKEKGCMVFTYEGKEISLKGGGGPTCLTRPLKRSLR